MVAHAASDATANPGWLSGSLRGYDHDTSAQEKRLRDVIPTVALRVRGALRLGSPTRDSNKVLHPSRGLLNRRLDDFEMYSVGDYIRNH